MEVHNFEEDIKTAIETMRNGGVILYPTDTVWGIGCDATNPAAVKRIYDIKRREESKSLIVLVDTINKIQGYIDEMPDIAWDLIEMTTKPLTIIYDGAKNLANNLIAKDGSIAIRVTEESFSSKLCERMKTPIVSTSANISGEITPQNFAEISEEIIQAVDYVVKYRQNDDSRPKPSSIIKLGKKNEIKIIRE